MKHLPSALSPANANIPKKRRTPSSQIHNPAENRTIAIPSEYSGDLEELEERVKSMMEKSQNKHASGHQFADRCKVCGKEGKGNAIKYHIEKNHLEGIAIPCNLCDRTFRSNIYFDSMIISGPGIQNILHFPSTNRPDTQIISYFF